jgi:hypothetical protein
MFREHYNIRSSCGCIGPTSSRSLKARPIPETKRKTIGRLFIEVFEEEAKKIGGADFLAQGTLYPDVIESVSFLRRPVGHDQVAPQCRRPARAHEHASWSNPARTVQGRGPRAGPRTGPARQLHRPPPVPRPGPRHPLPRRHHPREARHPAQGRRDLSRRDPQGRSLRHHLAGLRRAAAGADRRRDGRRPHL